MALVTAIGGRESNSFITLEEAEVLIESLPDCPTAWSALEDTDKELRLKLAAAMMNYIPFRGKKIYAGQALTWPRSGYGSRFIPPEVKQAQAYIAYSIIHRGLVARGSDVTDQQGAAVRSVSIGGLLSVSFGDSLQARGLWDSISSSNNFPLTMILSRYITAFRGGSVGSTEEEPTLSTTTTTASTTSTTISTTSTTLP